MSKKQFSPESGVYRDADHSGEGAWRLPEITGVRGRSVDAAYVQAPNKTPEPTPTSVTPRAIESKMKCSIRIAQPKPARVAPAVVVAHL